MRTDDIVHVCPSAYERTEEIYLPTIMGKPYPMEELPLEALQHAMCAKSGGRVEVCKACPGGCRFGRELVRRMENASQANPNEIV